MHTFPTALPLFDLPLPWPTDVNGTVGSVLRVQLARTHTRTYAGMRIARYADSGALAATAAVVMDANAYSLQATGPFAALVATLLRHIAAYQVMPFVRAANPGGYPDPTGISLVVHAAVAAYLDGGGGDPPAPWGSYAGFRVLPAAEYASATVQVPAYRYLAPSS